MIHNKNNNTISIHHFGKKCRTITKKNLIYAIATHFLSIDDVILLSMRIFCSCFTTKQGRFGDVGILLAN